MRDLSEHRQPPSRELLPRVGYFLPEVALVSGHVARGDLAEVRRVLETRLGARRVFERETNQAFVR